ncbi:hypothetical protein AAVH_28997 [Aphelenchoides avenae]|nr:hypothetical protein AAVH_28997 [Aphelenchus avenae]
MPGPTIRYLGASGERGHLTLTIRPVSAFLDSENSVLESERVDIGGVQWYTVAKTFVENGTTYLAYYLRGTKEGNWRRWLNAQVCMDTTRISHSYKLLSNELRVSSSEDDYAEWGCDKLISKEVLLGPEGFVRNDELRLRLYFDIGIDIFSEESAAHHTNMKLVVQGQPVFLLTLHSTVFKRLFKDLQEKDLMRLLYMLRVIYPPHAKLNAATVKAVYQMAKSYGVGHLLEKCDDHSLGSTEFSLADKIRLADKLKNNKLFDRLVRSLDKPSLKGLAVNADVSAHLRGKAVELHFRQLPRRLTDPPLALQKILFVQDTKDKVLLAYIIVNLKRVEHKNKLTKNTLIALFRKAQSLIQEKDSESPLFQFL